MEYNITLEEFENAYYLIKPFIKETPLQLYKDNIYLKRESLQVSGSFKWSGVLYSLICVFDFLLENKYKNYHIVTQSTGNHAIAMLKGISILIPYYVNKYPSHKDVYESIIPVIFANKNIRNSKLHKIEGLFNKFIYHKKGFIDYSNKNYEESLISRVEFLKKNKGRYMEHGGRDIMIGYGSIAIDIDKNLPFNKSVTLYSAVGAGGVLGIGLCLSLLRPTKIISVQTEDFNAFNRSIKNNEILCNKNNYININVSDGIAVDRPEKYAFNIMKNKIHKCLSVNTYKVINLHLKNNYSGSTNISLVGLDTYQTDDDFIVVLDCEGNW
jgi:threonine dehydratase